MSIKLSICIPTYNRAAFLSDALDSIIAQATDEVEIVVSDNASTDNTEALINEYQNRFPRIRYHRNAENLGADRNFLKVVELAQGEYCWLLGSDDALMPSSINIVLNEMYESDIIQTDAKIMSFNMTEVILEHEKRLSCTFGTKYKCRNKDQILECIKSAYGRDNIFAYMSTIIVKKDTWDKANIDVSLIGSGWVHVAKAFCMMNSGAIVKYLGLPLVMHRTGNDSFLELLGRAKRLLVDLDYLRVSETCFLDFHDAHALIKQNASKRLFTLKSLLSNKYYIYLSEGNDGLRYITPFITQAFHGLPYYKTKTFVWNKLPITLIIIIRKIWQIAIKPWYKIYR